MTHLEPGPRVRTCFAVGVLLLSMGVTASCTSGESGRHVATPTATPSPTTTGAPTTSPPSVPPFETGVSWQLNYRNAVATSPSQYSVLARRSNQQARGFAQGIEQISGASRFLVGISPPAPHAIIGQSYLRMVIGGRQVSIPEPALPGPPRQTVAAVYDHDGVAWMETASTDLFPQDWEILYYPEGGRSRLVATSAHTFPHEPSYITSDDQPVALTPSTLFWSASHVHKDGKSVASLIMSTPRNSSTAQPRIAVRNAGLPAAQGKDLFYVSMSRLLPDPTPATYQIKVLHPNGTIETVISRAAPRKGDVNELAASPDYLAWTFNPHGEAGGTIYVLNRHTHQLGSIRLASQNSSSALSLSGHYLAWGNGSSNGEGGEYLLNLQNHHLWKLGSSFGYSEAFVAGTTVVWAEQPQPNHIVMVFTRWLDHEA